MERQKKQASKTRSTQVSEPPYALRRGLGFWDLTLEGQHAVVKHEQGMFYVAYLLLNPPEEPIHGLDLALKVNAIYGRAGGATFLPDPGTGATVVIPNDAIPQERSLGIDDAEAVAALRRKQLELEAVVDDEEQIEPVRAEAMRELEQIYDFQKKNPSRTTDAAQKAVRTVRMGLRRLHRRLALATDAQGAPHSVLRGFAFHLYRYLLIPSARRLGPAHPLAGTGLAGCFTYEPPPGVLWQP